jgi:hypothetical protein
VNSRKFIIMKLIMNMTNDDRSCPVVELEFGSAVLKTITSETMPNIRIVKHIRNEQNLTALVLR